LATQTDGPAAPARPDTASRNEIADGFELIAYDEHVPRSERQTEVSELFESVR